MAKIREPEKTRESDPESVGEEDEASSEEIGSSESDSDQEESQPPITKKPSTPTPKKAHASSSSKPNHSSSGESGSESDQPDPTAKPVASKSVGDLHETATKKLKFKAIASGPTSPTKSAAAKRPAPEKGGDARDSKRPMKKPDLGAENSEKKSNDDPKKLLFQRLWSEEDEIVVLKGMIDYKAKKKADPAADLNAFHDFIRKNLHIDVSRVQLQTKIRRLKKKYGNNRSREKKGKDKPFLKGHELKAYELSKKIWGNVNDDDDNNEDEKVAPAPKGNGTSVKKTANKRAIFDNEDSKEAKLMETANGDVKMLMEKSMKFHEGNFEDWVVNTGFELMEDEERVEAEREWKKLREEETALYLKKLDFISSRTKKVLEVLKSSEP